MTRHVGLARPVVQDPEVGECLRCALASLFGIPKEETPLLGADLPLERYDEHKDDLGVIQDRELGAWCRERGLTQFHAIVTDGSPHHLLQGLCIATGPGPRGYDHAVVWDLREFRYKATGPMRYGEMIHDPHPSGVGLVEVTGLYYFLVADPARFFAWAARRGAGDR